MSGISLLSTDYIIFPHPELRAERFGDPAASLDVRTGDGDDRGGNFGYGLPVSDRWLFFQQRIN